MDFPPRFTVNLLSQALVLVFFSYCSFRFKVNSIRTLLRRTYTLSSSYLDFHNDVMFLKKFFYNNGFTTDLFEKTLNKFLQNKYCPKQPIITVPKEVIYLRIPFLGDASKKLERCLCEKLSYFYPDKQFRFVATNSFCIRNFFRFKDVLPTTLRSSAVYNFTCPSCQAGYVGSTLRSLKSRVSEHLGQSARTGRPLHTTPFSAIRDHCLSCKVQPSSSHFRVLATCNRNNLRILESLYISKLKPSLNNMLSSYPLNIV